MKKISKFGRTRPWMAAAMLLAGTFASAGTASAAVTVDLVLCLDSTGSMSAADWTLEKSGTVAGLNRALYPTSVALPGPDHLDGQVRVTIIEFPGSNGSPVGAAGVKAGPTVINSAAALSGVNTIVSGLPQLTGGGTNISSCIDLAKTTLCGAGNCPNDGVTRIIDISTDGDATNPGGSSAAGQAAAVASSTAAKNAGINALNVIGVGNGFNLPNAQALAFPTPVETFDASLNQFPAVGDAGFVLVVGAFDDYEPAIYAKLQAELSICGNGVIEGSEVCDEGAANGTATSCCSAQCTYVGSGTTCRAAAGVCDLAENCTGSSATCPSDALASSNTVCRGSAGVCDVAENCTGSGASCPADAFVTSATTCRGTNGVCDVAENCTGSAAACPADSFDSSATVCRSANGVCDVAENCTGSAASCPADSFDSSATVCRSANGICDVAENCTGQGADCPVDGFVNEGTVCRGSNGVCDEVEECTGASAACPADSFLGSESVCRGSNGVCDVAENCTGSSAGCPGDSFVSSATTCRGTNGVCDVAENCTGSSADCPGDSFSSSATVCRATNGVCDVAESCTGSAADCPSDGFASSDVTCRATNGICDVAESCTGSAASCPADVFVSSATTCRESAGVCDVAESCTGSSAACPANSFVSSATTCRASNGVCDLAEKCTGASASCPADSFVSSSTVCRASAGVCDVAETCTGSAASCPANGFQSSGTTCTNDSNVCTDDKCNGSGTCQHTNNTSPCDDGLFCTVNDTCSAGTCNGSPRACGDEVQCTVDACNEQADSCQNTPSNGRCEDDDACTLDTCDVQDGCHHVYTCKDICRAPGFWGKESGNEHDGVNVTQQLLDSVGGVEACGQTITETSNEISPYLEGLGLDSALEGLCVKVQKNDDRALYRELVATALNCAMSGSSDCDSVVSRFIDVSFTQCSNLCAGGVQPASSENGHSLAEICTEELHCYNIGGRMIGGKCATGSCDVTDELCGGGYGVCPPVGVATFPILQVCKRFPGNCRDEDFCQPGLGVCPAKLKVTSHQACKEAKVNDCTIDDCVINSD